MRIADDAEVAASYCYANGVFGRVDVFPVDCCVRLLATSGPRNLRGCADDFAEHPDIPAGLAAGEGTEAAARRTVELSNDEGGLETSASGSPLRPCGGVAPVADAHRSSGCWRTVEHTPPRRRGRGHAGGVVTARQAECEATTRFVTPSWPTASGACSTPTRAEYERKVATGPAKRRARRVGGPPARPAKIADQPEGRRTVHLMRTAGRACQVVQLAGGSGCRRQSVGVDGRSDASARATATTLVADARQRYREQVEAAAIGERRWLADKGSEVTQERWSRFAAIGVGWLRLGRPSRAGGDFRPEPAAAAGRGVAGGLDSSRCSEKTAAAAARGAATV